MAIIKKMQKISLERDAKHTEVEATIAVVLCSTGKNYIQIDTYGSANRKILGKKSQSIRLSRDAIDQIVELAKQI